MVEVKSPATVRETVSGGPTNSHPCRRRISFASAPLIDPRRDNYSSKNRPGPGRGGEEQHAAGFGTGIFPGMRHTAW
jgi:hypothetical protein